MNFLPEEIEKYAEEYTEPEPELLQKLNRETWQKVLQPRMLSGHFQGRMLSMLSHLVCPLHILEIGTYTGYSALCLAEGLKAGGQLHTIDIDPELRPFQLRYFESSSAKDQITLHTGNAMEIIPTLNIKWDLVFIDADKENYVNYYDLLIERLPSGAVILIDNVLWSGKVLKTADPKDEETRTLQLLNQKVHDDVRVQNVLLPIRDGLTVLRKK